MTRVMSQETTIKLQEFKIVKFSGQDTKLERVRMGGINGHTVGWRSGLPAALRYQFREHAEHMTGEFVKCCTENIQEVVDKVKEKWDDCRVMAELRNQSYTDMQGITKWGVMMKCAHEEDIATVRKMTEHWMVNEF